MQFGDGLIYVHQHVAQEFRLLTALAERAVDALSAGGRTPFVVGAAAAAAEAGAFTACVVCVPNSSLAAICEREILVVVGPEVLAGSTRLKAGTAQKLVLNMISTTVMIQLGRVEGNKMVDMMLSNNKLLDRGVGIVMKELGVDHVRHLVVDL